CPTPTRTARCRSSSRWPTTRSTRGASSTSAGTTFSRARTLRSLAPDEHRIAQQRALEPEVTPPATDVLRAQLARLRMARILGHHLLDRAPVQALVVIPVVLGGADDAGDLEPRRLEPRGRLRESGVSLVAGKVLVGRDRLGQRPQPPVGLRDRNEASVGDD